MESHVNLWLHLLAFATYTGATAALALICLPIARREEDPVRRLRFVAQCMRVYDPLSIGALGVVVMTGAFRLTVFKAVLRSAFFEQIGQVLAWKLFFSFILIILATYVAFGIGHRLVATSNVSAGPVSLDAPLARLRTSLLVALLLVAVIVWIALAMHPRLLSAADPVAGGTALR